MIEPTVGRIVWFYPNKGDVIHRTSNTPGSPMAAIVTEVHNPNTVNLCVFSPDGYTWPRPMVHLVQEEDGEERPDASFCEWMPFQKGQAKKYEEEEAAKNLTATEVDERQASVSKNFPQVNFEEEATKHQPSSNKYSEVINEFQEDPPKQSTFPLKD